MRRIRVEEHTILATDDDFGTISLCPGGVVHVNLAHYGLKFVPSDFMKLAELVAKARANLGNRPQLAAGKPHLQVVPRDSQQSEPPSEKE
jgi:hypothetical protein